MASINYEEMKESIEAAQTDTTPFLIPDEELTVVGDANKTEINCHDFEITFRVPETLEDGSTHQFLKTREFKNVYITPRMDSQVTRLITAIMPYFKKPNEDGTVTPYTKEELKVLEKEFDTTILDIMYETVGVVLKIDPAVREFMTPESVLKASINIFRQFPEIVNEGDTFFGLSSVTPQKTTAR